MGTKSAQALWQDYRFLTKEMKKFLEQQDMELFYELMDQRERLQTLIDKTTDEGFKVSLAGKRLLTEVQQDNQGILHDLQVRQGRAKRHHQVAEVYSGGSTQPVNRIDWQR